jgi:hypothetical protein
MKTILFMAAVAIVISQCNTSLGAAGQEVIELFDFSEGPAVAAIVTQDASASTTAAEALRIETGTTARWPGITLKAPHGKWDLSTRGYLEVDASNVGDTPVTLNCRIDNPGADGKNHCVTGSMRLNPHARGTILIPFGPKPYATDDLKLIGMRGGPFAAAQLDPANVTQLVIFVTQPKAAHAFDLHTIRVGGGDNTQASLPADPRDFLPMIDRFGQYIHRDWPGKTHSERQLKVRRDEEARQLTAAEGPSDWDQYGGWSAGPQRKATGYFRVEKYHGKWWLIDPDGRLFWSHGVDCVGSRSPTPITDRETYYRDLPAKGSPLGRMYGTGTRAAHGYFREHTPFRTYDFARANLLRKYGDDFPDVFARRAHKRLRSWGLNTIGNWSDATIYRMQRTPYVVPISFRTKVIEGSKGYWGKFPDVFDPGFREELEKRIAWEKDRTADDPWCIGYFVDNELSWGDDVSLAVAALTSPADQAAKQALVTDLKAKYTAIDRLNAAWGSHYTSWDALLAATDVPDLSRARPDLAAFYTKTAETYFQTIRELLRHFAPHHLYLGCRFAWVNDRAARAAARFCDIVTYNRYAQGVTDLALPHGIDRPLLIGEFHFGALDRGLFHTGLRKARDQAQRAEFYRNYVRGALQNPHLVGTHWFQFRDQPTTGRSDGENYQIGLIDICDTPYGETIQACQEIGREMYRWRTGAVRPPIMSP